MHARPTTFKNITYRSQIEARWAVFFDALKLEYEYEPGTYSLPCGGYLPDFYLHDLKVFIEIKNYGHSPPLKAECIKAAQLAKLTNVPVFIFFGPMSLATHHSRGSAFAYHPRDSSSEVGLQYAFSKCPKCLSIDITRNASTLNQRCGCILLKPVCTLDDLFICEARRKAASYSF